MYYYRIKRAISSEFKSEVTNAKFPKNLKLKKFKSARHKDSWITEK